jgi:methionine-S-sulfoxide reductase
MNLFNLSLIFKLPICASIALMGLVTLSSPSQADTADAYFAGGCFWCTEADFEKIEGVISVTSGFMGGEIENPPYEMVASGKTKHRETVYVRFDDNVTTYQQLLDAFWRMHDPSDAGGSFVDRGFQYSSAIYYRNAEQYELAKGAIAALEASKKYANSIATDLVEASEFYAAEDYHQDYYLKSPIRYKYYRYRSGRDQHLEPLWANDDTSYQIANPSD